MLTVSSRTLDAIAKAIRQSMTDGEDDRDRARAAVDALVENASLRDWDALGCR
jgi:hypothetical protein